MFFELLTKKVDEFIQSEQYIQDEEETYRQAILEVFTNLIETGFLDVNEKDEDG